MSTDLRHDLHRESEDRHPQNWREYLEQERARAKSRDWLKHRQHVIRMEAKCDRGYYGSDICSSGDRNLFWRR